MKPVYVATAWPYSNGSLHLGHVSALLGADIIARYFRLKNRDVLFVSGSDCHGTPIAVEAEKQGVPPIEIAEKYHKEFKKTLGTKDEQSGLRFSYDLYTKTTTQNHKEIVQKIFLKLCEAGHIYKKTVELPFCPKCERFLPDRYVEGECPACNFRNARGDQCDECGNLLDPNQLINPRCKICSTTPEWKPSEHFYLKLSDFQNKLEKWIEKSEGWRANAKNFSLKLIQGEGLKDRAITRDIEWGIDIPIPGYETKKIYVWFEAVCGYLTASIEWAKREGDENLWKKFWENSDAMHYYVHGKDNIPFHTLIWPAILMGHSGLHLPDKIISSEYLTFEKKQFSKSRNWGIWLPEFLERHDPETLRYYLVINGPETSDADFSWLEYQAKINNELIGNFANFINRTLSFVKDEFPKGINFEQKISPLTNLAKEAFESVGQAIENGEFRNGLKIILRLTQEGNKYLSEKQPWNKIKDDREGVRTDLHPAIYAIYCVSTLIEPFLPATSEELKKILGIHAQKPEWKIPEQVRIEIGNNAPLFKKIESSQVEQEISKLGKQ